MKPVSQIRKQHLEQIADRYESQRALADAIGKTPGYINQLLTGHRTIGEKTARKIEEKLNLPHLYLDADTTIAEEPTIYKNAEPAMALGEFKKIPIVGHAQLGDNGYWTPLEYPIGHGDGYIEYPTRDRDAYALRCIGDSMKPRIKHGEYVIVEPNHPPQPGDEVLVKAMDGRVMIKTFLYHRDGKIHLISINEAHPPQTIPNDQIIKIHFIAAIVKNALWMPD